MEETALLAKISRIEKRNDLYSHTLWNLPLYRLIRYSTRKIFLNTCVNFKTSTNSVKTIGIRRLKFVSGFWSYIGKKDLTIVFPFNRLSWDGEKYFDKFTDPVIEISDLKDSNYVIVDPSNCFEGYQRLHRSHTLSNESRTISYLILRVFTKVFIILVYRKNITNFLKKVQETFSLPKNFANSGIDNISNFYANYCYYLFWFKRLNPRRVLIVFREGYLPILAACKKLSIPIAEFQHGITLDKTMAYTGDYDKRIDPDYFISFGRYWKPQHFGMQASKMIYIGWAYKKFVKNNNENRKKKHILVISSTAISSEILKALQIISKVNSNLFFDIRLHPAENYNKEQQKMLQRIPNASIVDNRQESYIVLPSYYYVIGEASSVLFEALSVGCKVGLLNLCGLRPPIDKPGIRENFFVVNNREDFKRFLTEDSNQSTSKAEFYSDFDNNRFMEFIRNKM